MEGPGPRRHTAGNTRRIGTRGVKVCGFGEGAPTATYNTNPKATNAQKLARTNASERRARQLKSTTGARFS